MPAVELDVPCDPLAALASLGSRAGTCLLQSGVQAHGLGRYSILATNPIKTLTVSEGRATVRQGDCTREFSADPFCALEKEMDRPGAGGELPFYGGPIGYFAYDAGGCLESIGPNDAPLAGPDARFAFFEGAIVFDHERDAVFAASLRGNPTAALAAEIAALGRPAKYSNNDYEVGDFLSSNFTRSEYERAVESIREYIRQGEVYQVNLAQRFETAFWGDPASLFQRLARENAAPYAAYLDFGDEQILSSSPERFLHLREGKIQTRPIKGTRPLGKSEQESRAFERELHESEKDRSELLMIVDLERNDLGRVARPGTVTVEKLFALERYATVIHQTADVLGEVKGDVSAIDCVRALFPGGSITGAPKIRAMQVIDELERGRRGVYTGSIGYLDGAGNADFNIAIRTMRIADGKLSFHAGGGVVWDSDPKSEYEESILKAKALSQAVGVRIAP